MEKLIARSRAGDVQAFAELTRRYQNMAFAQAVSRLGDFHLAEDAVQEAFIAAYYGLDSLTEPMAFPGWLRGIVRHQCGRILRQRACPLVSLQQAETMAAETGDPVLHAERRETADIVMAAIMALPDDQREVVVLYYLRDYSQREAAAFLNLPVATINNRLHAARLRLRRRMTTMVTETLDQRKLTDTFARRIGEIVQVRGPLVDVLFDDRTPELFENVSVTGAGEMYVVQRLGVNLSRCIAVDAIGLKKGQELMATPAQTGHLSDALLDAMVQEAMGQRTRHDTLIETGIKIIDLLSPLPAGGSVGLYGGAGVGKVVLLGELVRRVAADARGLSLFYFVKPQEVESARQMVRTDTDILGTLGTTDKVGSLETFWLLTDRATDPDYASSSEGLDAAVFCSPLQAVRGLWPALDPLRSRSRLLTAAGVGDEHFDVAMRVRDTLRRARELMVDPRFLEYVALGARKQAAERAAAVTLERLPQLSAADRLLVERAQKLEAFFTQPFFVAEPYTAHPGAVVSRTETVAGCRDILDGRFDHLPASAFHFVGGVEDALAKAAKT